MMMAPETFLMDYENASYFELLKLKNELIQSTSEFENDYDKKNLDWTMCPLPDVHYQWNLQVLGKVAVMLQEAFNTEFEMGDKNISDFYKEMKRK